MFLQNLFLVGVLGATAGTPTTAVPSDLLQSNQPVMPGFSALSDDAFRLSIRPVFPSLPPDTIVGQHLSHPDFISQFLMTDEERPSFDAIPAPEPFDFLGKYIDTEEIPGPLGTASGAHFQTRTDPGHLSPFLSLFQDVDELDAHERDGVGAGLSYRFDNSARVDLEVQFLDSADEHNPALGSESRASLMFTLRF